MVEYGTFTRDMMALSKTVKSITNSDYYIAEAHALSRELRPIIVHGGTWRGQSDGGQPAWSEHDAVRFKSAEEALDYVKNLPRQMWGFMIDPATIRAKRVVERTIVYYDEYPVEDAAKIVEDHGKGFAEYMATR